MNQTELDLALPNKLGHLSFEAYAETYGNDEMANLVEQHYLKSQNKTQMNEVKNEKGSNMFLSKIEKGYSDARIEDETMKILDKSRSIETKLILNQIE